MRIGELATRAGVTQKAVRYYEQRGLLKPSRTPAGYREFDDRALAIVQTIRQSQNLGMQVDELRDVIDLLNQDRAPCATVRALLADKRAEVARRIKELRAFDAMLASLETTEIAIDGSGCAILQKANGKQRSRASAARRSSVPGTADRRDHRVAGRPRRSGTA